MRETDDYRLYRIPLVAPSRDILCSKRSGGWPCEDVAIYRVLGFPREPWQGGQGTRYYCAEHAANYPDYPEDAPDA